MERLFITGAAGFIGSHLSQRLLSEGRAVLGFDNFHTFYPPAVKRQNIAGLVNRAGFEMVEGDIRDASAVESAMERFKPNVVVHLAAMAGVRPSIENPSLYADVNVLGTSRMLDAAGKHGVKKFIFASSSSVYGNNTKAPFSEADPVEHPISPYAATKRAGELLGHTYWHVHRLPVTCLRFFTVYGPRQRPDLAISKFMRSIAAGRAIPVFGDGTTSRDYTYIDDIVDGVVAAIGACEGFDVINLGSHRPVGLMELIRAIETTMGMKAKLEMQPMQPGDVERTYADISHAAHRLGYAPHTPLADGLARQWAWLQSQAGVNA